MAFMDNETGEIVTRSCYLDCNFDVETGECVGSEAEDERKQSMRKTKFNVPKSYLTQDEPTRSKEKCCLDTQESFTLTSKKKVMELKEVKNDFEREIPQISIRNNQNYFHVENHPRTQQNEPSTLSHSIAVHFSKNRCHNINGNRNNASCLESQQKYKKR